jgi:hypothetical protein
MKVATVAIQGSSSTPKLFYKMSDDDDHISTHICLMAKGEKVKTKSKSSPIPSDISSSELSESSSDDDLSDNDEFIQITRKLDPKTKIFITKLLEDLESVRAELATRDDDLLEQENMYIACKEALVLERSEVDSLTKVLTEEQREHALTKKANIALNDKYCVLKEKHNKLEKQYYLLLESNSQPSNTKGTSNSSTSLKCETYHNIDKNTHAANLMNMCEMRKEISRLNVVISEKCNKVSSDKENPSKKAQYKDGRHPYIKDGLGLKKGAKTNGRKVINGYECVKFTSKGKMGTEQPAQKVTPWLPRAALPTKGGSAAVKGGSAAPHRKGKAIHSSYASEKPKKHMYQQEQKILKPRDLICGTQASLVINPRHKYFDKA